MNNDHILTIRAAEALILINKRQEALQLVEHYVCREPDSLDAWLFLAQHYLNANMPHAATAWQQVARIRELRGNQASAPSLPLSVLGLN